MLQGPARRTGRHFGSDPCEVGGCVHPTSSLVATAQRAGLPGMRSDSRPLPTPRGEIGLKAISFRQKSTPLMSRNRSFSHRLTFQSGQE